MNKRQEEGTEFSDSFVRSVKRLKDGYGEKDTHHLEHNDSFYFNLTVFCIGLRDLPRRS